MAFLNCLANEIVFKVQRVTFVGTITSICLHIWVSSSEKIVHINVCNIDSEEFLYDLVPGNVGLSSAAQRSAHSPTTPHAGRKCRMDSGQTGHTRRKHAGAAQQHTGKRRVELFFRPCTMHPSLFMNNP